MRYLRHLLLLASLACAAAAPAADRYVSAMSLAIEHFNARHEKDIVSWGPEHRFMLGLLDAVGKTIPTVSSIGMHQRRGGGFHDPFGFLIRTTFTTADNQKDKPVVEDLRYGIELLTEGCGYRRVTTIEETQSKRYTKNQRIQTSYALDDKRGQVCTNMREIEALAAIGLNWLIVEESTGQIGEGLNVHLGRRNAVLHDMEYLRRQALKVPNLERFTRHLQKHVPAGIGRSSSISLRRSSGEAKFSDPVYLRYWKGWGDCPAGCIQGHIWHVRVTPRPAEGGKYTYQVKLVREEGDPLPKR